MRNLKYPVNSKKTFFTNNIYIVKYSKYDIIRERKYVYEIIFYEDKNGESEVADFIRKLQKSSTKNKTDRINYYKIIAYLDALGEMGTRVGEPVTKHLEGEIWELRPLQNRILYAYYKDNKFILLHHFLKKTRKTPRKEIEKAKNRLRDFIERNG